MRLVFHTFHFDRQAKEVVDAVHDVEVDDDDNVEIQLVARVLRVLYPKSVGVRVTFMFNDLSPQRKTI